jgi:hypothetical protein
MFDLGKGNQNLGYEKLYHFIEETKTIIELTVSGIEYTEAGIYIFAKTKEDVNYRFILITYKYGKTHFGNQVFVSRKDAVDYLNLVNENKVLTI